MKRKPFLPVSIDAITAYAFLIPLESVTQKPQHADAGTDGLFTYDLTCATSSVAEPEAEYETERPGKTR